MRHKIRSLLLLLLFVIPAAGCATCKGGMVAAPADPCERSPGKVLPGTHVVVFHIGQADAMLVVNDGWTMLVDAGATWTARDRENFRDIGRTMEKLVGHRRLDYFVVSHYHQDHIGLRGVGARAGVGDLGLWGLLADEGVTIGKLVDRGFVVFSGAKGNTQKHYERAIPGWRKERKVCQRYRAKRRDRLFMGKGLEVEVVAVNGNGHLMSVKQRYPGLLKNFPPSENDYSIVLKLTRGDFEMITGGDLSGRDVTRAFGPMRISYHDIESVIAKDIGDVEVYRVHHHGSKNSSNDCFMQVLRPEVSLFSTGMNSYHHPDMRVFDTLKKMGRVFITSGADQHVYGKVKGRVIEKDVHVVVAPDGRTYKVNGVSFTSLSEEAEKALPGHKAACEQRFRDDWDATKADEKGGVHAD